MGRVYGRARRDGVVTGVLFRDRRASAFSVSLVMHVACFAVFLLAMRHGAQAPVTAPVSPDRALPRLVWLNAPGAGGGGGGGGGNGMKDPPRRAEMPGRDAVTVPAAKPPAPDFSRPATIEPDPIPQLIIPVARQASSLDALTQIGAIGALPSLTPSQGPGDRGGAGTGQGPGDGPGRGPGLRDGRDGETGGDVFQPGNGVTMPVEIQKGVPRYTTEAMRARIQGSIMVECVVQPTGACTNIRVRRSFDPAFGLDQEAINAAAQWRFRPGTRRGQPVPVMVTMEIAFALR